MVDTMEAEERSVPDPQPRVCGVVMPIAPTEEYPLGHWSDVKRILDTSIENAGFTPRLVSEANSTGVIHARIVQNLAIDEIAVCDISSRNPNVMFELGIRIAFDKPTVLVKDDETKGIFDIGAIEYLEYPKSLRHGAIEDFKEGLRRKIVGTYEHFKAHPGETMFLKHFQIMHAAKLPEGEAPLSDILLSQMSALNDRFRALESAISIGAIAARSPASESTEALNRLIELGQQSSIDRKRDTLCFRKLVQHEAEEVQAYMGPTMPSGVMLSHVPANGHYHIRFRGLSDVVKDGILAYAKRRYPTARWVTTRVKS
ncbi:MAG TPA: hypothetical protein VJ890_10870 [Vineibacter sp.]|nr:hypothetical protein [Vineibacter sp.]